MWLGPELNRRHADFQSAALPTELPSREIVDLSQERVLTMQQTVCRASASLAANLTVVPVHGRRINSSDAHRSPYRNSELARQFHRACQQSQIMVPRNFNRAEFLQM